MTSVKTPGLSATKDKTANLLADTVAELTRRAIRPELEPFESTLKGLGGQLQEHVIAIETQCKSQEGVLDSTQRRLTHAVDDFHLQNVELNGLIKEFQDDEDRVATATLRRLEQVSDEWKATLSVLRSDEERSAMRATIETLSQDIQSSFDAVQTEMLAKISETESANAKRAEQVLTLAERIDATKDALNDTSDALGASGVAMQEAGEKIHSSMAQIHDDLKSAEQRLEQLTSTMSKATESLDEVLAGLRNQSAAQESTVEFLKADETRLARVDQVSQSMEHTKGELTVVREALFFQKRALMGVIILAAISILSSVTSIFF